MRPLVSRTLALICAVGVAGCPRGRRAEGPVVATVSPPEAPPTAGALIGGRFVDFRHRVSIARPQSWILEPGRVDDALRMRMIHDETGVVIELWIFDGSGLQPRRRGDCLWTFQDQGPYTGLPGTGLVGVASCTPATPGNALVRAWLKPIEGAVVQLEVHYPEGTLIAAEPMTRAVLATVRTGDAAPQ